MLICVPGKINRARNSSPHRFFQQLSQNREEVEHSPRINCAVGTDISQSEKMAELNTMMLQADKKITVQIHSECAKWSFGLTDKKSSFSKDLKPIKPEMKKQIMPTRTYKWYLFDTRNAKHGIGAERGRKTGCDPYWNDSLWTAVPVIFAVSRKINLTSACIYIG